MFTSVWDKHKLKQPDTISKFLLAHNLKQVERFIYMYIL